MYLAISSYSVLRLGLAGCRCCVMDILAATAAASAGEQYGRATAPQR